MGSDTTFIPAFEGNWQYQSFLLLPSDEQLAAAPGTNVIAKKWAMGKLLLADGTEMEAAGQLKFAPGIELKVHLRFTPGEAGKPAEFKGTGTGETGPTKGAVYELSGWAFPDATGKLAGCCGSVRAARGSDAYPDTDLGGMPTGTIGSFSITK